MFTLILAIVCIILGVILRVYDDFPGLDLGCVCIGLTLLIVYLFSDVPTALDVYQGKTTLEITYKDGIPIDSVVVFKNQKEK